jgi:hypothetical protein
MLREEGCIPVYPRDEDDLDQLAVMEASLAVPLVGQKHSSGQSKIRVSPD